MLCLAVVKGVESGLWGLRNCAAAGVAGGGLFSMSYSRWKAWSHSGFFAKRRTRVVKGGVCEEMGVWAGFGARRINGLQACLRKPPSLAKKGKGLRSGFLLVSL